MKYTILAASLLALSLPAAANDFTISGEAGATTNYVWRGVSQSNEDFAIQAGIEGGYKGFSVGFWGSSVDFQDGDEAQAELDIYGGYSFTLAERTSLDVGGIYYMYPGADSDLDYDFWEINAGLSHEFQNGIGIGGKISYTPDYTGNNTDDAYYYEGNITIPVYRGLYVDGHIGHSDIQGLEDYTDYGIGVGYAVKNFDVRVGYSDTDLDDTDIADDQWMLSAKVTF